MTRVTRINLKTPILDRSKLIDFCLHGKEQYVAIGWSSIYKDNADINNYKEFYDAVKNISKRINPVLNVFRDTVEGDLFWTRDLEGNYWICRVIGEAQSKYLPDLDVGAIVPVNAYKVGMQVPGQIKASFNHARGGTAAKIAGENINEFSKYIFNRYSHTETYAYNKMSGPLLDNLPDFDLEELMIAYLQIKKNYYVLSNSIARK